MNLQEDARIKEAVNKPSHYVGEKGLEVEYLLRYAEKNGVEDLKKARKKY